MNGFLPIDKPLGVSSRAVVNRVDQWFPGARAGHAGTLDPLATGVLVIALGAGTRLIEYIQDMGKSYRSTFCLGAVSDTDDATGFIQPVSTAQVPTLAQVRECLQTMVGEIQQVPPEHSAVWVDGKRAYHLARAGKAPTLEARKVCIHRIDILRFEYPTLEVEIDCGKGTYIRSIARDLGRGLACGAYVEQLCRTRVGSFTLEKCVSSESTPEAARQYVQPLAVAVTGLPPCTLPAGELDRLIHGVKIELPNLSAAPGSEVAVLDAAGRLQAIALWKGGRLKPLMVFAFA